MRVEVLMFCVVVGCDARIFVPNNKARGGLRTCTESFLYDVAVVREYAIAILYGAG